MVNFTRLDVLMLLTEVVEPASGLLLLLGIATMIPFPPICLLYPSRGCKSLAITFPDVETGLAAAGAMDGEGGSS